MAVQWEDSVRNAVLEGWEAAIGPSPRIRLYAGAKPANTSLPRTGLLLCDFGLAADWATNAVAGAKSLASLPISATALASGEVGYYSITNATATRTLEQGDVTATGGGGDMTIDSTQIAAGQEVRITAFTKVAPQAS